MQEKHDIFYNLFVFDIANNHMGDVDHGIKIIRELHKVVKSFNFSCAIKFQYRDIDSFIHPDYKNRHDFKYIKRFQETRLSDDELFYMKQEADNLGFVSICTPFDEISVNKIIDFNFDIIKVASCSFTDWPLMEKIADTDKPIIASTAGATVEEIDRVVIFLKHRRKKFALMHCVGEYPTLMEHININQIDFLKNRYPDTPVGYSTHEDPCNLDAVKLAIAKGSRIFERHVGIETKKYPLNAYSSTPEQIDKWLLSAWEAIMMLGVSDKRRKIYEKEKHDLKGLMRGVFAKQDISTGQKVTADNTFFAIPNLEGQLVTNNMSKYTEFVAKKDIRANDPVFLKDVSAKDIRGNVQQVISKIKDMLTESKVHLPHMLRFELSHHYGIDFIEDYGAIIINCVNREYCKKLIIMLPGQKHPSHFHKRKEETFQILSGELILDTGNGEKTYMPGEIIVVERGKRHSFRSDKGCIFEEISSTHYPDDSFYDDKRICENENRKTEMTFWRDWIYDEPIQ